MMDEFKKRKLSVLGCTGSIGTNTLNVVRQHPDKFEVVGLSCGQSLDVLVAQIYEFKPEFVSVADESVAQNLKDRLNDLSSPKIFWGVEGHQRLVEESRPDVLISAMSGTFGLKASLQAVKQNVSILGVANKEILVMAGSFILKALQNSSTVLVPVDSEHSAIFQSMMGNDRAHLKRIILTGSGGPFRTKPLKDFPRIRKEDALKHPNWTMGPKITVDSATMMNKGLEFIEAIRLFDVPPEKVKILVHPESIVHSMVEYCDGSFMAQLGLSDMRTPISLAMAYPSRLSLDLGKTLNLAELKSLHFEEPDHEKFPCLNLALKAELMGDQGPVVLNAANEVAVARFLREDIRFLDISILVAEALAYFSDSQVLSLEDVIDLDRVVKAWAASWKVGTYKGRLHTPSRETLSL